MIDPRTVLLFTAITSFIMGFVTLTIWRSHKGGIGAMVQLSGASMLYGVGHLLVGLRDYVNLPVSAIVGNGALMSGLVLFYWSACIYRNVTPQWKLPITTLIAFLVIISYYTLVVPLFLPRVAIFSLGVFILLLQITLTLVGGSWSALTTSEKFVVTATMVESLVNLLRFILVSFGAVHIDGVLSSNPLVTLYLGASLAFLVTINFGTALMCVERLSIQMSNMARIDILSGCFNRLALEEMGQAAFNLAKSEKRKLSLIILDADRFKNLNDNFGHEVGDEAIKLIGAITNMTVAEFNTAGRDFNVARFGGEEFVVIMPDLSLSYALDCGERIRRNLQEEAVQIENYSIHLTVSAGVSTLQDEDEDFSDLMKRADLALYTAKAQGRNCVISETEIRYPNPLPALSGHSDL